MACIAEARECMETSLAWAVSRAFEAKGLPETACTAESKVSAGTFQRTTQLGETAHQFGAEVARLNVSKVDIGESEACE